MVQWLLALVPNFDKHDRQFWDEALKEKFAEHVKLEGSPVVTTVARALRGEGGAVPVMVQRALAATMPSL